MDLNRCFEDAARHQDSQELTTLYRDNKDIVLTIDGLQPEKGHETLDFCSVVRGILNNNHGGPCKPAGIRMFDALADVQES